MTEAPERYVGGGVPRKEDPALITGQGSYTDDIKLPGMLHVAILRSPFAHAKITHLDVSGALERPGVVAAFTGEDLAGEWYRSQRSRSARAGATSAGNPWTGYGLSFDERAKRGAKVTSIEDRADEEDIEPKRHLCGWPLHQSSEHEEMKTPTHWLVARDEANYMGEPVAVVVATDRYRAQDALEFIDVDYEPMDAAVDVEAALAENSPLVHEELGTNKSYDWVWENGDIEDAFNKADITLKERYVHPRLIPNAIEPRAAIGEIDPASGSFILYSATQIPHVLKHDLSAVVGIPEQRLRVVAPEVGGGFGSKLNVYPEEALVLVLTRRLGRPVKWVEDRSENYHATIHGRGQIQDIEMAATSEGKILGVRAKILADMGAYFQISTPGIPLLGRHLYSGLYTCDAYFFECSGVFTNKTPTDAYRGAGRPEAAYAIERTMDSLAREVGLDPAEVRRRNFLEPFDEPKENPSGLYYDSGNYEPALDKAMELADYQSLREEQRRRRESGDVKQLGIGISCYTEACGMAPSRALAEIDFVVGGWEAAKARMLPTGVVEVVTGTTPHGQGHRTSWSQIAADVLGVDVDDVEVMYGDTALSPFGRDTYGSRSVTVGGSAVYLACQRVLDKAKKIAAHMLEAAEDDIEFEGGRFNVAGSPEQSVTMYEVAKAANTAHDLPEGMEPGLDENYFFDPPEWVFPFGAHICVVEVDTETGRVTILKYVGVDDCGHVVNPVIVDGQLHGGIAQGIAEALYEEARYDEDGTLTTASMADYMIPGAPELPSYALDRTVTPSPTNPLGVKGVGEAGTIGSPPAVINAVVDALQPYGIKHIDKPASPMRVWKAIQDAQGQADVRGGEA